MKKILLFLFCQLVIKTFNAQSFCKPGATWHFEHMRLGPVIPPPQPGIMNNGITGMSEFKCVNDTMINGITCRHLRGSFAGYYWNWGPAAYAVYNNFRNYFCYENNKVVYVWNTSSSSFDTVVNFNAAIGDKWRSDGLIPGGYCNARSAITVTDTGRVTINNISLKKIVTAYTNTVLANNTTYTVNRSDTIIERIMTRFNFIFPIYCEINTDPNTSDSPGPDIGRFMCYEDNTFALYKKAGVGNCTYVGTRELMQGQKQIKIYPNPVLDKIIIEAEDLDQETYLIRLTNVLGETELLSDFKNNGDRLELKLNEKAKGIYYLQVKGENGLLVNEKIIKE